MAQEKPTISYEDFAKLDIRTAKVLEVSDHPNADKLVCLKIDLGHEQRQIIAGLKPYMDCSTLVGKTIIVIANLEPRKMRGLESNGMLLAASFEADGKQQVVCLTVDAPTPPGAAVT